MAKIEYDNYEFDSQEEVDFYHWCAEAFDAGLIEHFGRCNKEFDAFELIGKQYYQADGKKKFLFHDITYTPDFIVKGCKVWYLYEKPIHDYDIFIDIKPSFSKHGDAKQFSIIRKLMMMVHGLYIHKITPEKLFLKTWVPEKVRYTPKTGKLRKKYEGCKTIKEFVDGK